LRAAQDFVAVPLLSRWRYVIAAVRILAGQAARRQSVETGVVFHPLRAAQLPAEHKPVQGGTATSLEIGFVPHQPRCPLSKITPGSLLSRPKLTGHNACVLVAAARILRLLEPERAHHLALYALQFGLADATRQPDDPVLAIDTFGCTFQNPVGLAAGFDKDAIAVRGLARVGFGFLELGTVTLRPQSGNPKPRLFRLPADLAVINRMGFNNQGVGPFLNRIGSVSCTVPIGINVGVNKDSSTPEQDYAALVSRVAPHAHYIVLNVSSPNTPGLRDLQVVTRLRLLLRTILAQVPSHPPLLVKIAPDVASDALPLLIDTCLENGVCGLVISNTTVSRPIDLRSPHAKEPGGLSGRPLFALSTAVLARAWLIAGDRLTLIGTGGVASGRDAFAKIQAGASLVQLYTAFAYQGPTLLPRLKHELAHILRENGFRHLRSAVGTDAERLSRLA
jgi:dihydroorotate dehydrogenase